MVTGASRGIGRALARRLAGDGFACALVARSPEGLAETVAHCAAAGGVGRAFPADLSRLPALTELVAAIGRWRGTPALLVNNAGAYHRAPLAEAGAEDCDRMIDLNLRALVHLTRLLIPAMAAAGGGTIVNIASVSGLRGAAGEAVYAASKHGLVGLSHSLSRELGGQGIKVSAICPGLVDTDMAGGRGANLAHALQAGDIADALAYVVASSARACPTQITLEPLRSPWPGR